MHSLLEKMIKGSHTLLLGGVALYNAYLITFINSRTTYISMWKKKKKKVDF